MDTTGTEQASKAIDTTTIAKRRDLPPLNVYVRIRPFIGDELERGENQKLLDILNEKHIAIKILPTVSNTIRNVQASYNEYEVTRIFDARCTQQDLFEQILEQPTNEIFTGSNWLLCTLGLTNSGKTHTMFGTPDEPGLIPKCLQRVFRNVGGNIDDKVLFRPDGLENLKPTTKSNLEMEVAVRNYIFKDDKNDSRRIRLPNIVQQHTSFQDLSVEDEHYSVWISFFELYNENILDLLVHPKDMKSRKNLRLMQNDESTIIKNLIQIPVFDIKEAEDSIKFGFSNRATSKTHLNEASSRSHAVLCITLITVNEFDEEPVMSHMYICDLAGNEPSTGTGKLLAETCNINASLMTFKDCVRVLNENQTAKKQMLVPYRNSVLTSIFRPFFVGRGRTIICCNVNPCATFVSQTNDLLKFCALAQKTIIVPNEPKVGAGGLIRQQRKSKHKGPKRLVKDGPLRGKNKKDVSNDDDEDDDTDKLDGQSMSDSSTGIPKNTKSITYWKYCTKKALDLLQKQATHRRSFLVERHRERIQTVQYLLGQCQQMQTLKKEQKSTSAECETLLSNLRHEQDNHLRTQQSYNDLILHEKQHRQKLLKLEKELKERQLHSRDEIDSLHVQIKGLQKQFDHLTSEHLTTIEQIDRHKNEYHEHEQHLQDEIQRLKRDLGLELYRKQDAEKKARLFEDKLRAEQAQLQKVQYDFTKTKHDLKTLQVKYDALQLEMIDMHRQGKTNSRLMVHMLDAKTSTAVSQEKSVVETQQRAARAKRRTNDESQVEQEVKKPKRVTRSRSVASSNNASIHTQQQADENHSQNLKRITRNGSSASGCHAVSIPIQQIKKNASNEEKVASSFESKIKPKLALVRARTKKQTIEPTPIPIQQRSPSPHYATIERDSSLERASFATVAISSTKRTTQIAASLETVTTTPKPSTFKRIQSLFRPSPTLTSSSRINRVLQAKSTAIAFGSSTPTQRLPGTLLKTTPGSTVLPMPNVSAVRKVPSPKAKYNLRTRLFANPASYHEREDDDSNEKKSRTKKPLRTRK